MDKVKLSSGLDKDMVGDIIFHILFFTLFEVYCYRE
jgi:hypothetical protein